MGFMLYKMIYQITCILNLHIIYICIIYSGFPGSVEAGILQALVPTKQGKLEWQGNELKYRATFTRGEVVTTKNCDTIGLAISWLARMEASSHGSSSSASGSNEAL